MGRYRLARLPALALGVGIPLAGLMVGTLLDVPIRRDVGLLVAVAAVLFIAWLGGVWPALSATVLLIVGMGVPLGVVTFEPPMDEWSLFLFAVAALMGTGAVESLYRTRWRVEAARDRARVSRRAEHAIRAELESVVAAIGDGILVADADGTISLINQAAADQLGRRPGRLQDLLEVLAPNELGTDPIAVFAPDGTSMKREFELPDKSRRIELSSFPLVIEGEPTGRVVVLRDVTEARRREQLREAFLSLLSHELRTPMTAVYGGATLLQRIGDELDAETRQDLRNDIVHEADRLSRLIDDLLVLTRVEEGMEVGHEPALLQHIVADVVIRDQRGFRGDVRFTTDQGLPPVRGDETSIRQVAHNLISNALKYSPAGSAVEVHVEGGSDEVQVRVLDRGPGMTEAESERVFEAFYRGQSTERMATGIGIGLFVSQRLVEAMGGRIWTRPREGGGSEFGFALPLWPLDADESPVPVAGTSAVW